MKPNVQNKKFCPRENSPSLVCRFIYICSQANEEIINVLSTLIYFSLSGNDGKHTALISSNILKTGEQTGLIGNPIL